MGSWTEGLTEEQKRKAGLLPGQMKARFTRQLAILRDPKQAIQCRESDKLQGALRAAIRRLE